MIWRTRTTELNANERSQLFWSAIHWRSSPKLRLVQVSIYADAIAGKAAA